MNSLAAAAVAILAWETNELFTPGFQLSFVLVLFIMGLTGPISRRLEPLARPDGHQDLVIQGNFDKVRADDELPGFGGDANGQSRLGRGTGEHFGVAQILRPAIASAQPHHATIAQAVRRNHQRLTGGVGFHFCLHYNSRSGA